VLRDGATTQAGAPRLARWKDMGAGHQFAVADFPVKALADLYHKRWRIEESYKRLKHHAKLKSVSGLTQHAVLIDVYAKVLADNLNALVCMGASDDAELAANNNRSCNRAYAGGCLQRLLPRLVMGLECLATLLGKAYELLGANSHKRRLSRKSARPNRHIKPHLSMAYKG
jgi:hypothetical protein